MVKMIMVMMAKTMMLVTIMTMMKMKTKTKTKTNTMMMMMMMMTTTTTTTTTTMMMMIRRSIKSRNWTRMIKRKLSERRGNWWTGPVLSLSVQNIHTSTTLSEANEGASEWTSERERGRGSDAEKEMLVKLMQQDLARRQKSSCREKSDFRLFSLVFSFGVRT